MLRKHLGMGDVLKRVGDFAALCRTVQKHFTAPGVFKALEAMFDAQTIALATGQPLVLSTDVQHGEEGTLRRLVQVRRAAVPEHASADGPSSAPGEALRVRWLVTCKHVAYKYAGTITIILNRRAQDSVAI